MFFNSNSLCKNNDYEPFATTTNLMAQLPKTTTATTTATTTNLGTATGSINLKPKNNVDSTLISLLDTSNYNNIKRNQNISACIDPINPYILNFNNSDLTEILRLFDNDINNTNFQKINFQKQINRLKFGIVIEDDVNNIDLPSHSDTNIMRLYIKAEQINTLTKYNSSDFNILLQKPWIDIISCSYNMNTTKFADYIKYFVATNNNTDYSIDYSIPRFLNNIITNQHRILPRNLQQIYKVYNYQRPTYDNYYTQFSDADKNLINTINNLQNTINPIDTINILKNNMSDIMKNCITYLKSAPRDVLTFDQLLLIDNMK